MNLRGSVDRYRIVPEGAFAQRANVDDLVGAAEIASRLEATWTGWAQRTYVDDWNGPDHTDWGQDIKKAQD